MRPMPRPSPAAQQLRVSFGDVYAKNFRLIWRVLFRMGVPREQLEDAGQEVFVTAYRSLDRFEGRSTVRTWLVGIAMRTASDARRRRRAPEEQVSAELPDGRSDPFRDASAHES